MGHTRERLELPVEGMSCASCAGRIERRLNGLDGATGTDLAGRRVTIVGDVLHSRVARSNVLLLHTLGAEVTLVAPLLQQLDPVVRHAHR